MTRRRLVLLVSAIALGVMGVLAAATILFLTKTAVGREQLRSMIRPLAARLAHGGDVYIGHLSGLSLTEITIDSIAIRDKRDHSLFLSTGRVTVNLDPRDFADNRIFIHRAEVEHPFVHIVQHENNQWNFKEIFASDNNAPPAPKDASRRNFGDYIVVDSARARDGVFLLTMPWHPDDTLHGAVLDSVIRAHIDNPQKAVARTYDGFGRTYAWRNGSGFIVHARLADPDSDRTAGQQFLIDNLSADEYEPTFKFRNVKGNVRHLADSIWFTIPHFDMPASTGNGRGRVWWGSDKPVRYDIAIRGDSVSLDDVNWVYPTLPHTGGGKLNLLIKNDPKNDKVVDFHLKQLDVRSTGSHLTGDMSFGTGAPLLLVRNVDVRADPVDFDLLRTLAGKPFPEDWQGQLVGTVKARGGPLTHFVVDDARGLFRDAHVPGAVSRFAGHGELDILVPAVTAFHGFNVDVGSLDLRTIEYLFPSFPRLHGYVSGTATLDSSYLDVRFSNAQITHEDGSGEPSRISGSGRVTYGVPYMIYDVALDAQPLSLTMIARSYTTKPIQALMNGPIHAKGTSANLDVATALQGTVGAMSFDGRLDLDSIGGYGVHGHGQFSAVNIAALLEKPTFPTGTLSGHYDADVAGETWATLHGTGELALDRTLFDSVVVYGSQARVHFADGRMTIDSLRLRTAAATLDASGGIGLPNGQSDSLHFDIVVDSLGGLRRYLATSDTTVLGAAATVPDSLSGTALLQAWVRGTMDSFGLRAQLEGHELYINTNRGKTLAADLDLRDLPHHAAGLLRASIDSVTLASVAFDTIGAVLRLEDPTHARFDAAALFRNGPRLTSTGNWARANGSDDVLIDSLAVRVGEAQWRLESPTRLALDSTGVRLDSLMLRNRDSAVVTVAANVPISGPAFARFRASRVPLRDVGLLAQLSDTVTGLADVSATMTGTKMNPVLALDAGLTSIQWRNVGLDRATSSAQYQNGRLNADLEVMRNGLRAVKADASLPLTATFLSFKKRNDSLTASLHADTTDLSILKAFVPQSGQVAVTGRVTADLHASGKWGAEAVTGTVGIINGSVVAPQLGDVTISGISGNVVGVGSASGEDSLSVKLTASTEGRPAGTVSLNGYVKNLFQSKRPQTFSLALGSREFHAVNKRTLADLYITTRDSLRLVGSTQTPVLTGSLVISRGSIFLADRDIARKQAVEFIADTTFQTGAVANPTMFSTLMTNLQPNVTVSLGDNVRLRSTEADVRLIGELQLVTSSALATRTVVTTGQLIPKFGLEGTLFTAGGTYNLNLALVQREFQVLPGGTVTFGGPPQNPQLDIKAQHNVRRSGDRDLGVIVNLKGPLLPYPVIEFSSTADYTIAQSDLISYLLTGQPGFDFGANPQATQALASILLPSLSAFAQDRLKRSLGSWVQFSLGTSSATPTASSFGGLGLSQYLYGATLGVEQQYRNIFLNVNTGFCQFQTGTFAPREAVGAKAEYRFDPRLSMKLAYDPPTAGRICNQQSIIGLVNTPGQFSLSFSHTWRF